MPRIWEDEVAKLRSRGMDESMAYAVATKHFKKKYGMTPQHAKKIGFEPTKEKTHMIDAVAAIGWQEQAEEHFGVVNEKAASWGALLSDDLVKIAEDKDNKTKKNDTWKKLLGVGALGAGVALGLRKYNNILKVERAALKADTKPLRDMGAYLVDTVNKSKAGSQKAFEANFKHIKDPYKRDVIMNTTKDIETWLREAERNIYRKEDRAEVASKLNEFIRNIDATDVTGDYAAATKHLRNRADNLWQQKK